MSEGLQTKISRNAQTDDMLESSGPRISKVVGRPMRAKSLYSQNDTRDRFEIWEVNNAWFWRVANTASSGAAIGIAQSREEAEQEARSCIDERRPVPDATSVPLNFALEMSS